MGCSSTNRRREARLRWHAILSRALLIVLVSFRGAFVVVAAEMPTISVELNKLDPAEKSCRAYFVIDNPSETALSAFKLDMVLFRTDGVIDRRLTLNLAPVRSQKKSVKIFDFNDIRCDAVGSFLLNEVTECTSPAEPIPDCADRIRVSSRAAAPFSK